MATLKSLVDETTNIKNELKTCHTNLKNNLTKKGVEVSNSDKMATLVDKVNSLKKVKVEIGTKSYALVYNPKASTKSSSYTEVLSYTMPFEGNTNINFSMTGSSSSAGYLQIYKNDEMLNSYTKTGTTTTSYSLDTDINENDVIRFVCKTDATLNILNLAFSCDFIY